MDNVTHSLAGLLLAESAVRLRARRAHAEPTPRFSAVAAIASVIAANLPDADLLYTGIGGRRLRYMLYHRGYSHTVVMAIAGAALLWALTVVVWRWRGHEQMETDDRRWLLGLLLVSTLSHLVLDWTNSYGLHPFWPTDDRWRYGDAMFIIEPWLWIVSVPALIAASGSRVMRSLLSMVLLAVLVLAWRVDLVSRDAASALTLGAVVFVALAHAFRPSARVAVAVAGWLAVTLVMAAGAASARRSVLRATIRADPIADVLDVVVSPLPANAVCMSVITVERSGPTYRAATARVSSVPSVIDAARCGGRAGYSLGAPTRVSTAAVRWDGEWSAPAGELAALARASCPALAALRFIRVPIWRAAPDSIVLLGDLRYSGGSGSGFTDVRVPRRSAICPADVPPWTPPRSDLLGR